MQNVTQVTQSPMNAQVWYLDLGCGHDVKVTAKRRPTRKHTACPKCPTTPVVAPIKARAKWTDPDYRRDSKTAHYCCVCQRDINPARPYRLVHLLGCGWILHPEDDAAFAAGAPLVGEGSDHEDLRPIEDYGERKIGMDCARKIGLKWSRVPVKQRAAAHV